MVCGRFTALSGVPLQHLPNGPPEHPLFLCQRERRRLEQVMQAVRIWRRLRGEAFLHGLGVITGPQDASGSVGVDDLAEVRNQVWVGIWLRGHTCLIVP